MPRMAALRRRFRHAHWRGFSRPATVGRPLTANEYSRPRLCENHRRPDQSDGTRQKIPLWFESVHFSWVSFIRIKNRRINSAFSHSLDPLLTLTTGRLKGAKSSLAPIPISSLWPPLFEGRRPPSPPPRQQT